MAKQASGEGRELVSKDRPVKSHKKHGTAAPTQSKQRQNGYSGLEGTGTGSFTVSLSSMETGAPLQNLDCSSESKNDGKKTLKPMGLACPPHHCLWKAASFIYWPTQATGNEGRSARSVAKTKQLNRSRKICTQPSKSLQQPLRRHFRISTRLNKNWEWMEEAFPCHPLRMKRITNR